MSWEIEWGEKGFRKDFTNVQGKQTKVHEMEQEEELQSLQVDFQKESYFHIIN